MPSHIPMNATGSPRVNARCLEKRSVELVRGPPQAGDVCVPAEG